MSPTNILIPACKSRVVENITILLRMQDSMNVFASTTPKMPFADPFRILRRLSPSAACCLQMVQHNTLPVLANYLAHLTDEPTVSILIETLWNALECRHRESVATVLIHPDCISALATALRRLASATSSHMPREVDRACRNELALLCADIALFAPIDSVSEFLHTGFVDLLCDLLFGDELAWGDKASDTAEEEPPCPDDFAFKRQLMSLAMIFAEHPAMLDQMLQVKSRAEFGRSMCSFSTIQRGLLQFCILYLEFDSSNPMVNRWSLRQIKRLQHQVHYTPFVVFSFYLTLF
ncbi:hypothetical protein DFS34DRAFT_468512 [Phlyctochytrium arcticum]|nr:hypothetical protein DFS34DRAFT_468512 [Phlyctochytrium arcticum]